jgi:hypothetical protein
MKVSLILVGKETNILCTVLQEYLAHVMIMKHSMFCSNDVNNLISKYILFLSHRQALHIEFLCNLY